MNGNFSNSNAKSGPDRNQSTISSPDWMNTLRKYFHTK